MKNIKDLGTNVSGIAKKYLPMIMDGRVGDERKINPS